MKGLLESLERCVGGGIGTGVHLLWLLGKCLGKGSLDENGCVNQGVADKSVCAERGKGWGWEDGTGGGITFKVAEISGNDVLDAMADGV